MDVLMYLAFLVLSGFFAVDVAFFTHDNLATLIFSRQLKAEIYFAVVRGCGKRIWCKLTRNFMIN